MTSTHKAGAVALVTALNRPTPYRAFFDGKTWREHGTGEFCVDVPATIQRLAVIEPSELLVGALRIGANVLDNGRDGWEEEAARLRTIADELDWWLQQPRITEPALWGIVRATTSTGGYPRTWTRDAGHDDAQWVALEASMRRKWDDLIDPVLVRDGVTS